MPRFPRTISLIRRGGTPISRARAFWLNALGCKNSLRRISPGWILRTFFIELPRYDAIRHAIRLDTAMSALTTENRARFKKVSTATLTTVLFKRGFRNTFIQGVFLLNRESPRMLGEAYTLRYIPAREDLDQLGAFEGRGHPQREAIEACPPGQVLVMDARRDATAATGGDILMTRLMVRGAAGIVTDGGLRDTPTIEKLDFPVYCGARSAPLNLVRHHAVDSQVPIACGGVPVYPGDVVVGDGEGVVVIPAKMADEVAKEAEAQTQFEDWVELKVKEGRTIFGLYPPNAETKAEYEAWKAKQK